MGRAMGALLHGHRVGGGCCGCPVLEAAPQDGGEGAWANLALPTGLTALLRGCCFCLSSRDGVGGKYLESSAGTAQEIWKILVPLLRQPGDGSGWPQRQSRKKQMKS